MTQQFLGKAVGSDSDGRLHAVWVYADADTVRMLAPDRAPLICAHRDDISEALRRAATEWALRGLNLP